MATKKDEKLAKFFAGAFKEVVQPGVDKLQENVDTMTRDIVTIKEDLSEAKDDIYQIKTKLEKIDDRLDRQGKVQDDLQERVEILETHAPAIA